MPDLFKEIIPSILEGKEKVIRDELDEKEYVPFLVNRALSNHVDCILNVNQINMFNVDKRMQYDFLFFSTRKYKRKFQPWNKKNSDSKEFLAVKEFFGYPDERTKEIMDILSEDQISFIIQKMYKGGVVKKPKASK